MASKKRSPQPLNGQKRTGSTVSVTKAGTKYTEGGRHHHSPSGRWADIQANPASDEEESLICMVSTPSMVMEAAKLAKMTLQRPIASAHLDWYLEDGHGADFVEDANVDKMLRTDEIVQRMLKRDVVAHGARGLVVGHIRITQDNYEDTDFQFAFGSIDRFDYVADFKAGTFHGWFKDRYEWHPFYPGIYPVEAGDVRRETNCIHAAAVELQAGTAADFWMVGEARVPLSIIMSVAPGPLVRPK